MRTLDKILLIFSSGVFGAAVVRVVEKQNIPIMVAVMVGMFFNIVTALIPERTNQQ